MDMSKLLECRQKLEQVTALVEEAYQNAKDNQSSNPPFKIDEGEIGTVAQILWTVLERIPIHYADGRAITNREEAAKIICTLLFGEPIKNWHMTVRMAFNRDSGLKFAEDIKTVAEEKKKNLR